MIDDRDFVLQESVLEAATNEPNSTFTGNGYTRFVHPCIIYWSIRSQTSNEFPIFSLSIIYGTFAVSNWIAPSVVALVGPKYSMVIGGLAYWSVVESLFLE